jgi:hypothetical protein
MGTRTLLNQPQTPPPYLRGGINARGERERERERVTLAIPQNPTNYSSRPPPPSFPKRRPPNQLHASLLNPKKERRLNECQNG